jgi:hypothetical protein
VSGPNHSYQIFIWVGFSTSPLSDKENFIETELEDKKLWPKQMWEK